MGSGRGSRTNCFAERCWPVTADRKSLTLGNDDPLPRLYQRDGSSDGAGTHYIGRLGKEWAIPFDQTFRAGVDVYFPQGTFEIPGDHERLLHLVDFHDIVDKGEKGSFSPLTTNLCRHPKDGRIYWQLKFGGDSEVMTEPLKEDCRHIVNLSPEQGLLQNHGTKFGDRGGKWWKPCEPIEEQRWYSLEYYGRFSRKDAGFLEFRIDGKSLWFHGQLTMGFPTSYSDLACKPPYTGCYDRKPRLTCYHAKRLRVEFVD